MAQQNVQPASQEIARILEEARQNYGDDNDLVKALQELQQAHEEYEALQEQEKQSRAIAGSANQKIQNLKNDYTAKIGWLKSYKGNTGAQISKIKSDASTRTASIDGEARKVEGVIQFAERAEQALREQISATRSGHDTNKKITAIINNCDSVSKALGDLQTVIGGSQFNAIITAINTQRAKFEELKSKLAENIAKEKELERLSDIISQRIGLTRAGIPKDIDADKNSKIMNALSRIENAISTDIPINQKKISVIQAKSILETVLGNKSTDDWTLEHSLGEFITRIDESKKLQEEIQNITNEAESHEGECKTILELVTRLKLKEEDKKRNLEDEKTTITGEASSEEQKLRQIQDALQQIIDMIKKISQEKETGKIPKMIRTLNGILRTPLSYSGDSALRTEISEIESTNKELEDNMALLAKNSGDQGSIAKKLKTSENKIKDIEKKLEFLEKQ